MRSKLARYMINLQHFAAVVDYGSINAAASALAITQPALTRSIAKLEDVFQVPLLERSARGVRVTAYGHALLDPIASIQAEFHKIQNHMDIMKGASEGRINCGAGSVSMIHIIPPAVSLMLRSQEKVYINLMEGHTPELLQKLKRGELDIVIGIEQVDKNFSDLSSEFLIEEEYHFCVSSTNQIDFTNWQFKDLIGHEKLVAPVSSGQIGKAVEHERQRLGGTLNEHRIESSSHSVIRHLVLNDNYLAFCSSILFDQEIRSGAMKILKGNWHFPPFNTNIYRRRDEYAPANTDRFVHYLKAQAGKFKAQPLDGD
ncbi:LysR family transcriptional regulator [Advenella sp. RU8]|uniref:LysR family transcriptional regulator n=1 Tax=Advenella sp. RU8 TaxID=3399575 RepID=UPI003AB0C2AB